MQKAGRETDGAGRRLKNLTGAVKEIYLVIVAAVVNCLLHEQGQGLHDGENEEIPAVADGHLFLLFVIKVHPNGVIGLNPGDITVNRQIRDPLISRVRRVTNSYIVTVFRKQGGHHLQRFVVLVDKRLVSAAVDFHRCVFIATHQRRRPVKGGPTEGNGIGVVSKTIKFFHKLQLFTEDTGDVLTQGPIQHQYNHVFAVFIQGNLYSFGIVSRKRLVYGLTDLHHVHNGHTADGDQSRQQNRPDTTAEFPGKQVQRQRHQSYDQQIYQLLPGREPSRSLILKERGKCAKIGAEEQIVHQHHTAQNPYQPLKDPPPAGVCQPVEYPHPDEKGTCRQTQCVSDIPQRMIEIGDIHKFLRRRRNHSRRNQHADEDRQEQGAEPKCFGVRRGLRPCFPQRKREPDFHHGKNQRQRQSSTQHQEKHSALDAAFLIGQQAQHHRPKSGAEKQNTKRLSGIFQLVEDRLSQGEQVVQRPVEYQAGGGIVQEHQKEQGHAIELNFGFQRKTLQIQGTGNTVDRGHDDGKQIDCQAADYQQSVGRAQIPNRAQRHAVQDLRVGQKLVGCHEERDFQQQGNGAAQGIRGPIVVLPVIGL